MAKSKTVSQSTGSFPTMGTTVATSVGESQSAHPQRGILRPRRAGGPTGMLEAATAGHRKGIQERLGAKQHPTVALYAANAAESSLVQRNVRTVPAAVGNRDFYLRRQYGQGV